MSCYTHRASHRGTSLPDRQFASEGAGFVGVEPASLREPGERRFDLERRWCNIDFTHISNRINTDGDQAGIDREAAAASTLPMSDSRPTAEGDRTDATETEPGPTGWLVLARHDSVARIVDALLDRPAHDQFTQTELADAAGVSRQSVHRHLDLLLELGVLEPVDDTSPQRYSFVPDSEVGEAIVRLDGAVNAAGRGPTEN